jgi:hypothetical protein
MIVFQSKRTGSFKKFPPINCARKSDSDSWRSDLMEKLSFSFCREKTCSHSFTDGGDGVSQQKAMPQLLINKWFSRSVMKTRTALFVLVKSNSNPLLIEGDL